MKKIFILTLFTICITHSSWSQAIEFSSYGGYMLSGSSNYYEGEIGVDNGPVFGATLGYDMGNGIQVQFLYNRIWSGGNVFIYPTFGLPTGARYDFDLIIENYHLGAEKTLGGNEMVKPYGAFSLGVGVYKPKNVEGNFNLSSETRFSMGLGLGVKVFPTEKIGLKIQAKMFMPMTFGGLGIFCSSGSGCGGGASFDVPIIHGEFSGGIVIRIDK